MNLETAIEQFVIASKNLQQALNDEFVRFQYLGTGENESRLNVRTKFLGIMAIQNIRGFAKDHLQLVFSFWQPPILVGQKNQAKFYIQPTEIEDCDLN